MSGPIVRTGTTPKYWQNWDNIFGSKKKPAQKKTAESKSATAKKEGDSKSSKKAAVKKKGKK